MVPISTATHGSLRFWVTGLCACAALLGGCDEAYVVPTRTISDELPKPDRVLVYDFAVTHEDVMLDRGVGPEIARDLGKADQTEEEVRVGRIVTSALAENLVKDLRTGGIQAYRALAGGIRVRGAVAADPDSGLPGLRIRGAADR
jgi:hypothetical protein